MGNNPTDRIAAAELTVPDAIRWERFYGFATTLYTSSLAVSTLYNFRHHGYSAQLFCTVGTLTYCSGISGRLALRPWIAQATGLILLVALCLSMLLSKDAMIRLAAILVFMNMYMYCESISTKFKVVLNQIRTRRHLALLAEHDTLTGLANRRHFEARLADACKLKSPFAILYIDLDKFKVVNDTYGHSVGDILLRSVADRLRTCVRSTDVVARLGGDEFAILQSSLATSDSAQELAARIVKNIAATFNISSHTIHIGASVGICLSTAEDMDPEILLSNADRALYHIKNQGGANYFFHSQRSAIVAGVAMKQPLEQISC